MTKILIVLLIALLVESVGVVLLSGGLKEIGAPSEPKARGIVLTIKRGMTNRKVLLGILLETIFFGTLLYLLSQRDVSLIWPLTSLGFVLTALVAKIYLHEEVSVLRWVGVGLIVAGAALVSYSEKSKESRAAPASVGETRQ